MDTMFDTLLQLPLFQGLTQEDFTSIIEKVKLHFTKYKADEIILEAGQPCDQLFFLLKGEIAATTTPPHHIYTLTEYFQAPYLVEPQSMFGMNTTHATTYTAHTEVHTVNVSKAAVLNELFKYEIFRLNYLNIISNRVQVSNNRLWDKPVDDLENRIHAFILTHVERQEGEKILKIKMEDLARYVHDTRLNVSKALNKMQDSGIVKLQRGGIIVTDARLLSY